MIWRNSRPTYCDQDHLAHKRFLSRHLHCSRIELRVFDILCAMWSEEIRYRVFLHNIESLVPQAETILLRFLKKMQDAGFAIIRTIYDKRGTFVPEKIILTDRYSPFFAQATIEEWYYRMNYRPESPYLTENTFHIPDYVKQQHIHTISLADLYAVHEGRRGRGGEGGAGAVLYRIVLHNVAIVLCFTAFTDFYSVTKKKVRSYLKAAHLIADLQRAQLLSIDSDDVYDALDKLEYRRLGALLSYMMQSYQRIIGIYPPIERHLQPALTILQYVNRMRSESGIQLHAKQKRVEQDVRRIRTIARDSPQGVLARAEYHEIIKEHGDSWGGAFEECVINLYTNSLDNPLLVTEHLVIHKDNLQSYASIRYTEVVAMINRAVVEDMHMHIKKRDLAINIHYSNLSSIAAHLLQILRDTDSIFYHLLRYPEHYEHAIEDTRYRIMLIFNIDLKQLYMRACRQLSFLHRFFYRLSNEYIDLKDHFSFLSRLMDGVKRVEDVGEDKQDAGTGGVASRS